MDNLGLAFTATGNHDIYADTRGVLWAVAKPGTGAKDSYFGDKIHLKSLMTEGCFSGEPTDLGLEIIEGLNCSLASRALTFLNY